MFARNFVRLYAMDLKLDPDALVALLPRVDIEAAPMPNPPARSGREKWDPRWTTFASVCWQLPPVPRNGNWYYSNHYGRHLITTVAAAPAPKPVIPAKAVVQPASQPAAADSFDNSRPVQVILTAHDVVWVRSSAGWPRHSWERCIRTTRGLSPADAQVRS